MLLSKQTFSLLKKEEGAEKKYNSELNSNFMDHKMCFAISKMRKKSDTIADTHPHTQIHKYTHMGKKNYNGNNTSSNKNDGVKNAMW